MSFIKQNEIEALFDTVSEINDRVKLSAKKQDAQYMDLIMVLHGLETKIDRILSVQESEKSKLPAVREAMEEEYERAKELVVDIGKVSASYLQKGLGVGQAKAVKIMKKLEEKGIVGTKNGEKMIEINSNKKAGAVPFQRKLGARYAQASHTLGTLKEKAVTSPVKKIREKRKLKFVDKNIEI